MTTNKPAVSKLTHIDILGCDVLIIGGGVAGSIMAHHLRKADVGLEIIMLEKRYLGSHEASYYIPTFLLDELGIDHLKNNTINRFTYEIDVINYISPVETDGGFVTVDYPELCKFLTRDISKIKGEFVDFIDRSDLMVRIEETNYRVNAKVIIDATGWESVIRQKIVSIRHPDIYSIDRPKIGSITHLAIIENCDIAEEDTMILCVGDYASYFWAEPVGDGKMKIGVGMWVPLSFELTEEYKQQLQNRMMLYLHKYDYVFKHAYIVDRYYAKIAADPVKNIVHDKIISFGEAAGMTNPYWLLGSGLFHDLAKKFTPVILQSIATSDPTLLDRVQRLWDEQKSKYSKLWAAARVIWNGTADDWHDILKNRDRLQQYTTADKIQQRQAGSDYSKRYVYHMWGLRRFLRAARYLVIFKMRMRSLRFYNYYNFKTRDNFVDITVSPYKDIISKKREELVANSPSYISMKSENAFDGKY